MKDTECSKHLPAILGFISGLVPESEGGYVWLITIAAGEAQVLSRDTY